MNLLAKDNPEQVFGKYGTKINGKLTEVQPGIEFPEK